MQEYKQINTNEKIIFESISNPNEPHVACVLLLDTSYSMQGAPIDSLNRAICKFKEQTLMDEFAKKRVDVAIIAFNDTAQVVQDFTPLPQLETVTLTAGGSTSMGEGINMAIDLVKNRTNFYHEMGTPCYAPWIFMISDGMPTDDISIARQRIKEEEAKKKYGKLKFWAIGVSEYDKKIFASLTKRCIELDNADFTGIFNWLSESMVIISVSQVNDTPSLPPLPDSAHIIPVEWLSD